MSNQRSAVSGQKSAISGQRSAVKNFERVRDFTELPPEPSTMVGLEIYDPAEAEKYAREHPEAQVYFIENTGITIRRTACPVIGQEKS